MAEADTVEALLQPFDGEDRAGEDPRRAEEFEAIGNELAKIGGVELEEPNWAAIVEWSAQLLRETGKDLRCAVYWGIGRLATEGSENVGDSVSLVRGILERYGADCHPRRARARASVLSWMAERAELELSKAPVALTQDQLSAVLAEVDECARLTSTLEGDPAPFNGLRSSIQSNVALKLSSEERVAEVRSRFAPEFADLALTMLEHPGIAENTELGLRIRRFVGWNTIPAPSDRTYPCEIPSGNAEQLRTLLQNQEWDELLAESEHLFLSAPLWLDLSYFTMLAAKRSRGEAAANAVTGALREVLARDPALPEGLDETGAPLASEDVRAWIRDDVIGTVAGEGGASEDLTPELKELLDEGRLPEALAQASPWLAHPDGRIRFARSVALARSFADRGSASSAHIVFRGLHNHLRQMTVKEWDPPIFTACIVGYLATKRDAFGLGPEDEPLMDELSALDPAALMSILPG